MKYIVSISILCIGTTCLAQGKSIRGATGTGYGQFSWGTSLETVQVLSPKLSSASGNHRVIKEARALKRLKAVRQSDRIEPWPRDATFPDTPLISAYERWITQLGLHGQVELGFFEHQLYSATVRLIVPRSKEDQIPILIRGLTEKYGPAHPNRRGVYPTDSAPEIHFDNTDSEVTYLRLKSTKSDPGFVKITYTSKAWAPQIQTYLNRLDRLTGTYAPERARPLPRIKTP